MISKICQIFDADFQKNDKKLIKNHENHQIFEISSKKLQKNEIVYQIFDKKMKSQIKYSKKK